MKSYNMKQCTLVNGDTSYVAWIPAKFTIINKKIRIKDQKTKEWRNWVVFSVSSLTQTSEYILGSSDDYKKQRTVSDI